MNGTLAIMRRELRGYFSTPLAYVFIVIFLILAGWFTFNLDHAWKSVEELPHPWA